MHIDVLQKAAAKLQTLRFQLQAKSAEQLRPRILQMQNDVRDLNARLRAHERQLFFLGKQLNTAAADVDTPDADNTDYESVHASYYVGHDSARD